MTNPTDTLLERYQQLLTAFYDVDAEPPVGATNRARFLAERSRRVLDIARLVQGGWPRTAALARAHCGDGAVHAIARRLPGLADQAGSIGDAVETSLTSWLESVKLPLLHWVFAFEQLARGRTALAQLVTLEQRAGLPVPAEATSWLLSAPFDLPRAVRAIDFLVARSATSALLREVVPLGPPTTVIGYRDGAGRMRMLGG